MCHLRAVVYTTVQFSKPLLCFWKEVLHMLSSQGWVSDFTQRFRSFLSQPPTSPWFSPTFCVPGPFSWSSVYTGFFSFPYHCTFPATTSASGMVRKKRGKNNSYFPHILWTIGIPFSVSLVKEKDYLSVFEMAALLPLPLLLEDSLLTGRACSPTRRIKPKYKTQKKVVIVCTVSFTWGPSSLTLTRGKGSFS